MPDSQLPPPQPTVASLLPSRWRQGIYAALVAGHAGYIAAAASYDLPKWALIVVAVIDAAGFSLAAAHTPNRNP